VPSTGEPKSETLYGPFSGKPSQESNGNKKNRFEPEHGIHCLLPVYDFDDSAIIWYVSFVNGLFHFA
jgi:hypothetical protein